MFDLSVSRIKNILNNVQAIPFSTGTEQPATITLLPQKCRFVYAYQLLAVMIYFLPSVSYFYYPVKKKISLVNDFHGICLST